MKSYDLILIGTGSAMNLLEPYIHKNPEASVAVIDKDAPGGICLNKGCIPSKILLYPADVVRTVHNARKLGIGIEDIKIDFSSIMERMRNHVSEDVEAITESLEQSDFLDYYRAPARFVRPKTLEVEGVTISGSMIVLCTGSRPVIPDIEGLEDTGYLTSETILELTVLPRSFLIIGGGYIAAEYGHFLSAMGSKVTVIGRNPRFLKDEEPEISRLAEEEMSEYLDVLTGYEVTAVRGGKEGKTAVCRNTADGKTLEITAEEILLAAGRTNNSEILDPAAGEIGTDTDGWIHTDEFLETTVPGVWALGDATGKHLFKHVANYESEIVYYNATAGDSSEKVKVDYHAVPHAVFSWPEIAAVGMGQEEASAELGEANVLVGVARYGETGKGTAMGLEDSRYFVKVILENRTGRLLGAHIIGPEASVLIQEIVNLMYTPSRTFTFSAMHIHPALSEVVQRAFSSIMTARHYREHLEGRHRDHSH
jgi:dihydrolipoamide dehydrogenase